MNAPSKTVSHPPPAPASSNMLASRTLPPPRPPSQLLQPTFFSIPRRYWRTMRPDDGVLPPPDGQDGPARNLRHSKSGLARASSSSSPGRLQENPSPTTDRPPETLKRAASLDEAAHDEPMQDDEASPTSAGVPRTVPPSAADLSGQVCLCQPEPKIPRPRNGTLASSFIFFIASRSVA